jgi:hypothetical protein
MYSPCIIIQERDTQHLLVGLGPPRVRTPTMSYNHHLESNILIPVVLENAHAALKKFRILTEPLFSCGIKS